MYFVNENCEFIIPRRKISDALHISKDTISRSGLLPQEHTGDTMMPDRVWNNYIGRAFGTVIAKKPLEIGENGYTEFMEKDFSLNFEKRPTLREFQSRSKER